MPKSSFICLEMGEDEVRVGRQDFSLVGEEYLRWLTDKDKDKII